MKKGGLNRFRLSKNLSSRPNIMPEKRVSLRRTYIFCIPNSHNFWLFSQLFSTLEYLFPYILQDQQNPWKLKEDNSLQINYNQLRFSNVCHNKARVKGELDSSKEIRSTILKHRPWILLNLNVNEFASCARNKESIALVNYLLEIVLLLRLILGQYNEKHLRET